MNWIARGFSYLTLDPSPRLRRLREEAGRAQPLPPRWPNTSWAYECRGCRDILFRVAWYTAPRGHDGGPRPPGWAIECAGCGRVTLMPDAPDMTEARRAQ